MVKTKGSLALASYDDIFHISDAITEVNAEIMKIYTSVYFTLKKEVSLSESAIG